VDVHGPGDALLAGLLEELSIGFDSARHLVNAPGTEAQRLEKYAEAVQDWNQAIELSSQQWKAWFRVHRANSRVRTGRVASAVAEVSELTKTGNWTANQWYAFACVYAVASGKSADKKQEYADRAMELLHNAVKAGYKDAAHLAKDKDLDVLHGRDDFKKLLAEMEAAQANNAKAP
jgi:hypothetical protein